MDGAGKNSYLNYLEFIIKDRPDYTINIIQSQLIFQNQLFNLEINMTVYKYILIPGPSKGSRMVSEKKCL